MSVEEGFVDYLWNLWPMLLCPLLMGPLMWWAVRMNRSQELPPAADPGGPRMATPVAGDTTVDKRLALLRAELEDVGARQAAIAAQIERLSIERPPAAPAHENPSESFPGTRRTLEV